MNTPVGAFNAAAVLDRLPASWRPDLLVVRSDSSACCRPINLSAFDCPRVLLVGDTHHLKGAISGLVRYAKSEPFTAVCLDYTRQHAHFFVEAGLPNVVWMPGLNVARLPHVAGPTFRYRATFVGQVGTWHARRASLCRKLRILGIPLEVMQASTERSRCLHAESQLNLNCSLNGDLNLRVLEVLQAGGALLTDRLAPESGLESLFEDQRHLRTYDSFADAIEIARELVGNPERCRVLGASGRAHYEETIAPERMMRHLLSLIEGGELPGWTDVRQDPRVHAIDPTTELDALLERIATYEAVQALHASHVELSLQIAPTIDRRLVADLVDLPNLRVTQIDASFWSLAPSTFIESRQFLKTIGLASRVPLDDLAKARVADVLLLPASDIETDAFKKFLASHRTRYLVIHGTLEPERLTRFGFQSVLDTPGVWQRPNKVNAMRGKR